MRVLFVNPIGELGGAERALLDILASLKDSTPDLRAAVLTFEPGPLLDEATALGATASVLSLPPSIGRLGDSGGVELLRLLPAVGRGMAWLPTLRQRLAAEQADIIHTNGFKAHVLVAMARPLRTPVAWHLHDFVSSRPLMRRLLPVLRNRAAVAIAVSDAVASDARAILQPLPVVTVLNGVRTNAFSRTDRAPADLDVLAQLQPAPQGTVRVGLIATLATWKGHTLFLEAARRLRDHPARFYIVGGGLYLTAKSQRTAQDLQRLIERFGLSERAGLVRFQRDIAPIFGALDIVVHASTSPEPFGRVVAEGMSAGRAVVAAASGGILEQIEDNKTGLLFPMGDVSAMTAQITRLLQSADLRARLGRAAATYASARLDSGRLGPETYRIYKSVCATP